VVGVRFGRYLGSSKSRDGKSFWARFRTTHEFFLSLVSKAKELFPQHAKKDALGRSPSPIELKVLGVLRILGPGVCFDDCQEGTFIAKETHGLFFHAFCHKFSRKYYPIYCHGPENEADLESSMSEYTSAGFPGCLGSTDGVHISWDRCHAMQKMLHTGKEKYPTIAYNVTVNHRRWIMASCRGFFGSYNDKTIVKYDAFINDIRHRKTFHDYNFF
jgi:Plant transposon protein